jgi:predicted transcriptional regulator of viral defense system
MNRLEAMNVFRAWDKKGMYVFTKHQLQKLFPSDNAKTLTEGIARLVKAKLLIRACRGVYVNPYAHSFDGYTIEHIAKALRPGEYNYVSLESILSEYGVISQIPMDVLTVMTTGREGLCKTAYGVIEFTHTKRSIVNIIENIQSMDHRPLRIAYKHTAWRDLKRVGRNTNMVNLEELEPDHD